MRVALVCAASKGLGYASAEALGRAGMSLVICSRRGPALESAVERLRQGGADVHGVPADLRRPDDIDRLLQCVVERYGGLDVLVNNTGGPPSGPFMSFDDAAWVDAIDSILLSVVRLCRGAVPLMRGRGGGRIINITSITARQPVNGLVLSNALRAAVTGLSKTLATELAADGILVNCVAPGYTRTDRVIDLAEAAAEREGVTAEVVERRTVETIPLGRMGAPEEFAAVVRFLASPDSSYVTGVTLPVDGGWIRAV